MKDLFHCRRCGFAWEMSPEPIPPTLRGPTGWHWPITECARCGSLYFDWVTYGQS